METIKKFVKQFPNNADLGQAVRDYVVKEKDICVKCGRETIYPKTLPITNREYYVEGAGQLCGECFLSTYKYL